jgi:hypothetical protein
MAWCLIKHRDNFTFTFTFIWWVVTLYWLWWKSLFCIRSLWEVFQFDGHFSHNVRAFLYRDYPDCRIGRADPLPASTFSRFDPSELFFKGFLRDTGDREKLKVWTIWVTESSELQSAFAAKYFSLSGEKINVVLIHVERLIVPILRSTEHKREFVISIVRKCIVFSSAFYCWRYRYIYIFFLF